MLTWNIKELAAPQSMSEHALGLLPLFSSCLSESAETFREASLTENRVEATRLCHRLRGSASLYGFKLLAAALFEAEKGILGGVVLPSYFSTGLTEVAKLVDLFSRASGDEVPIEVRTPIPSPK